MNAQPFDQVEHVFSHLGKDLSATSNAVEAAHIILNAANTLIRWEAAYLILYDPEKGGKPRSLLVVDTINGEQKIILNTAPARPSENMLKAIANDGFLSLYEQTFTLEPSQSFGDSTRRTLSQLFVPIKSGKRIIGLLSIQSYQANAYTEKSLETLKALSNHCAGALERIWAQEALSQMVERLKALYQAAHVVSASFDMERLYQAIHAAVEAVMPCDDFVIDGYDTEKNEIIPLYAVEYPHRRVMTEKYQADHGLAGTIVHSGKSILMNSVEEMKQTNIIFELFVSTPIDETQSVVAVPMVLHGKVIGMISAQSHQQDAYTGDDQYLLELLATHAAICIENARLFATIQKIADTDPLTGLLTRRKFYELAELEFARAEQEHIPLSVIALDVDNFKKMNDEFGHRVGDEILRKTTQELRKNLRSMDILCRYGGEEFVIVMPDTRPETALQIAERLRQMAEKIDLKSVRDAFHRTPSSNSNADAIHVTVSIGVAPYSPACVNLDQLIDQADHAMYEAKHAGRNCVRLFSGNK
jgi:diguanylate cyclase (GGDEF)-like protein